MNENTWPFILICGGLLVFLLAVSFFSQRYDADTAYLDDLMPWSKNLPEICRKAA